MLALLLQSYHEKEAVVAWSKCVLDDTGSFVLGAATCCKTRALKGTLKRWVDGMGLEALAPKSYSSEAIAAIGKEGSTANIAFLTETVLAGCATIRKEKLTLCDEPVVPELHRRKLPQLGTATTQRIEIEGEQLRATDDVRAAAVEYRKRPLERRPQRARASTRPALPEINAALVGRRVHVMYEATYEKRGGGQVTCNRWFPGEIKQVSTSGTREGRKKLGLGWIYVAHDDGTKNWLLATRPTFYNAEKPGAWRFEPADDDDDGDDDEDDGVRDDDLVDADDEDESDFEYDDDDGA